MSKADFYRAEFDFPFTKSRHADPNGVANGVNRWRTTKQVAEGASILGSLGTQTTGIATNTGIFSVMAGASVGTGGVALIAGGGALAVGTAIASGVSANKTYSHILELNNLHNFRNSVGFTCSDVRSGADTKRSPFHEYIANQILDYIVHQKKEKFVKKSVGAVGLGLGTLAYATGRAAWKKFKGVKGAKRNFAAQMLAVHLITHNCVLTEKIFTEICSLREDELEWLKAQDSDIVAPIIAAKMKSK